MNATDEAIATAKAVAAAKAAAKLALEDQFDLIQSLRADLDVELVEGPPAPENPAPVGPFRRAWTAVKHAFTPKARVEVEKALARAEAEKRTALARDEAAQRRVLTRAEKKEALAAAEYRLAFLRNAQFDAATRARRAASSPHHH